MAKTKISEFSATPANNTDIDSINIAEGCAPSGINDAIRELMAQLKDFQTGAVGDSFNGPIGATTASTGAFTTLSSTGNTTLGDASGDAVTINGTVTFANANPTLTAGTASGVTYLNGSKVLTSGSALVFDGSSLGIGTSSISGKLSLNETDLPFMTLKRADTVKAYFGIGNGSSLSGSAAAGDTIIRAEQKLVMRAGGDTGGAVIDASGNLGLGVTPSAWRSTEVIAQIGNAFVGGRNDSTKRAYLGANLYKNSSGTDIYLGNGFASLYQQNESAHAWFSAASGTAGNAITFTQAMTLDASGNLGVGTTSPTRQLSVVDSSNTTDFQLRLGQAANSGNNSYDIGRNTSSTGYLTFYGNQSGGNGYSFGGVNGTRMVIDTSGNLLVGKTASDVSAAGTQIESTGTVGIVRNGAVCLIVNRLTDDGTLVSLRQASTEEGTISVSGTTVSYNGGHLSRWAQMLTTPELFKGTVMSNLDEMNVYTDADGNTVANEQLNKVKVSDTEGDVNVAGVFVNWSHDEDHNVDEINMAMTGDMIIRIAQGVTVVRGDLLMSAGDGTAKPQGDDIVRSKTVAKVTSNHVTCTYADGSYCVPCVLMAC